MLTYSFYGFSCIQLNEWPSLRTPFINVAEDSKTCKNFGYLILNLQINVNNVNIVKHIISHIKFTCHIQGIHYICEKHPWLLLIQTHSSLYVHTCQSEKDPAGAQLLCICQIHFILTKLSFLTQGHGIDISFFIYTEVVPSELLIHVLQVCSLVCCACVLCAHVWACGGSRWISEPFSVILHLFSTLGSLNWAQSLSL